MIALDDDSSRRTLRAERSTLRMLSPSADAPRRRCRQSRGAAQFLVLSGVRPDPAAAGAGASNVVPLVIAPRPALPQGVVMGESTCAARTIGFPPTMGGKARRRPS